MHTRTSIGDTIVQKIYCGTGVRHLLLSLPGRESQGRILSITEKHFPLWLATAPVRSATWSCGTNEQSAWRACTSAG